MVVTSIIIVLLIAYTGVLFGLNRGISAAQNHKIEINSFPAVAVVVACKNEANNIDTLLKSLLNIDYPKDKLEFVFVDDHSDDATYQNLLTYRKANIRILKNSGKGKKAALQTAVSKVNADWIAFTDADCTVKTTWIKRMFSVALDSTHLVLGPVFISANNDFLSRLQAIEFYGLQGATAGSTGLNMPLSANGANMMCKRSTFEELDAYAGNLHITTGDDLFLLMAVTARYTNAVNYACTQDAAVRTLSVRTWKSYFSQRVRWASKGSAFTDQKIQGIGLVVFLMNTMSLLMFVLGVFQQSWEVAFVPFMVKILVDLLVVIPMKKVANEKMNWIDYFLSGVIYPTVVVVSVIVGLFKGSMYQKG